MNSRVPRTKPAPGTNGPLIPGDPEREAEATQSKEGIPLFKTGGGRFVGYFEKDRDNV